MSDFLITPEVFRNILQPHVLGWPEGEVLPLAAPPGCKNWGTVVKLGRRYLLAWVSANEHGRVMENGLLFDFKRHRGAAFCGYEKGPASFVRVIPTATLRVEARSGITDQLMKECMANAVRALQTLPETIEFNRNWSDIVPMLPAIVAMFQPKPLPKPFGGGMRSPEGHAF